jgi:hypothetical protein
MEKSRSEKETLRQLPVCAKLHPDVARRDFH